MASINYFRRIFTFTILAQLTICTTGLLYRDFLRSTGLPSHESLILMHIFPLFISTHSYGVGMNVSSGLSQTNSVSEVSSGIPWISALNFWNAAPCNGLVTWSYRNFPVVTYLTLRYPIYIPSLIRKCLACICFFWFSLDNLPLFLRSIALKLPRYITASSTSNSCASINYLDHKNKGSMLSSLISSASVELLEFSFCLFDMLVTDPHTRDIVALVWLRQSGYIAYEASTHHFTMFSLSTLSINGMWMVIIMYCSSNYRNFRQSSSLGVLTLVVRNSTVAYISLLLRVVANKSWATVWWDAVAHSFSSSFLSVSSLAVNKCSDAGVFTRPCIVSVKSDTIFFG